MPPRVRSSANDEEEPKYIIVYNLFIELTLAHSGPINQIACIGTTV